MQVPLQITFRDMEPSPAIEARIREQAEKLERFFDRLTSCRVVVEAPHRHRTKGQLYAVRIDMTVPGRELVVSRERRHDSAHEDVYVAIRDAFQAAVRQLEDHARERRGEVKNHVGPPEGRVLQLFPDQDYGFIAAADGREIYFHRNSVAGDAFDQLEVGTEVRFAEARGDKGPQASTVHLVGK